MSDTPTPRDTTPLDSGLRVTVGNGKYTVISDGSGNLRALRYGEEWRDCTGDGLILALAHEVEAARALHQRAVEHALQIMTQQDDHAESLTAALDALLTNHSDGDVDATSVAYDNMFCDAKVARATEAVAAWRAFRSGRKPEAAAHVV